MTLRIVPSDMYPTMQSAIDDSSSGDSIKILAGTFDGFEVDVDNLKIFGCGIGRTIIAGAPAQGSDDGIVVNADRTTLQGFTVQGYGNDGVLVISNNNVLKNIKSSLNTNVGICITGRNNLIIKSTSNFNGNAGIDFTDQINTSVHNCAIHCISQNNSLVGYRLDSLHNRIIKSQSKENNIGISSSTDSARNTVMDNKVNNNSIGIIIFLSEMVLNNLFCNNFNSGIVLPNFIIVSAMFNIVDSNIVRNNGTDVTDAGILVEDGTTDNTIRFNKARNNFDFDIEADPPADLNNTFDGNQCGNSDPPGLCT
ncbi:hypothetical protein WAK64_13905 [Bacillus spongiae]|uniref:Periplasmic copper-binding protein NosD beta helix domain-containing protein n=1 Tax=Bacillus spongiae TaxID=2683610 RepID=A0ABU8HG88_9BACI